MALRISAVVKPRRAVVMRSADSDASTATAPARAAQRMPPPKLKVPQAPPAAAGPPPYAGRVGFTDNYNKAYTMSQLYGLERPPPIPVSEHQARGKQRAIQEICEAGRRKGKVDTVIKSGLETLDTLLPGVISLHKAKASEWVTLAANVDDVLAKVIALKTAWPSANIHSILLKKPKLLLKKTEELVQDSAKVKALLAKAPNPDAIVTTIPDMLDPLTLSRSLVFLKSALGGKDPVDMLQREPEVVLNMLGESEVEDSAEYGELSTKD